MSTPVDRIAADALATAGLMGDELARQAQENALVLEVLRDAVARAEAGDVIGVAVVTVSSTGSVGTSFAPAGGAFALIGGLEAVKLRILAWLDGGDG